MTGPGDSSVNVSSLYSIGDWFTSWLEHFHLTEGFCNSHFLQADAWIVPTIRPQPHPPTFSHQLRYAGFSYETYF